MRVKVYKGLLLGLVAFLAGSFQLVAGPITYGSAIQLRSAKTQYFLHRSGLNYYKSLSTNILEMVPLLTKYNVVLLILLCHHRSLKFALT